MSNCLGLVLKQIEEKYGDEGWQRFSQERTRIFKAISFDIFSGYKNE